MHLTENANLYTFVTGLIVLTLLLIIYIVSIIRQQKNRMRFFKLQVNRDMELIEEERKRIAFDLHDDFGSVLSIVRMGLASIQLIIPNESIVTETIRNLDDSLDRVRELSHNLVPQTLSERGLIAAIDELVYELSSPILHFHFTKQGDDSGFLPAKSLALFRVIQEVLTNAVKHSKASHVHIVFSIENKKLLLTITDDGIGFDVNKLKQTRSFGLSNIRSRLNLLDATHTIDSAPGKGTMYKLKIPLASLTKL